MLPTTPIVNVPRHVAIIMDGNGRWAASRGLPRLAGHEARHRNIRRITDAAGEIGIQYLTLWAFSTENWSRPAEEVRASCAFSAKRSIARWRSCTARAPSSATSAASTASARMRDAVLDAIELTRDNDRLVLTLAFNYGGRQELISAIRRIDRRWRCPQTRSTTTRSRRYLFTSDLPDPDLIIRTSGEYRMSNFLVWQSAYSELYFSPVLWPEFGPDDLEDAVRDFGHRERRFGNISAEAARTTRERE